MKTKYAFLFSCMILVFTLQACLPVSMLRHGNSTSCEDYLVPGVSSERWATWQKLNGDSTLILNNSESLTHEDSRSVPLQIQVIDPRTGEVFQDISLPIESKTVNYGLSRDGSIIAVRTGGTFQDATTVFFNTDTPVTDPLISLRGTEDPVWHPNDPLLAVKYFPDGYDQGTNLLALYDFSDLMPERVKTFELERIAIGNNDGWSSDGEIIAVDQLHRTGAVSFYIDVESNDVTISRMSGASVNCIFDLQWSPNEQIALFAGQNEDTNGWDIFIESPGTSQDSDEFLINVTDSPNVDEYSPIWSPNGNSIAFVRVVQDEQGELSRELFLLEDLESYEKPVQLTDAIDEFVDSPYWISDDELAYLSFSPSMQIWSLNTLSLDDMRQQRVMDIPQSLYLCTLALDCSPP